MTLRSAVEDARENFLRITVLSGTGQLVEELTEVHQQLEPQLRKLQKAMSVWATLSGAELIQSTDASQIRKLKERVRPKLKKFRERLAKSPPEPKGGTDFRRLEEALDQLSSTASSVAKKAWADHCRPVLDQAQESAGVATAGQDDLIVDLQEALEQLAKSLAEPPTDKTALRKHEELKNKVLALVESVQVLDVPDSVQQLLDASRQAQGARLGMLTPEVYEWIRDHPQIRDSLKILLR